MWCFRVRQIVLSIRNLAPALQRALHNADTSPGKHKTIEGIEKIDKTIIIDQSPIGRTPRSNPATYTKVFDEIRKLFSQTTLSKERGYTPGHFSFNVKGGRCEACSGAGSIKLEMNSSPDVWITCDVCEGKRYTRECLEVTWKGKTIHDVLEMPIGEAVKFFENHKKISPHPRYTQSSRSLIRQTRSTSNHSIWWRSTAG